MKKAIGRTSLPAEARIPNEHYSQLGELLWLPIGQFKARANHAREHGEQKIVMLAAAMQEFQILDPVMIDDENVLLAGHARIEAAKRIGVTHYPAFRVSHLTPGRARAFSIAANRLSEKATWNRELLYLGVQEILLEIPDFHIETTGFEIGEIDALAIEVGGEETKAAFDPDDELPVPGPAVTLPGDIWNLGSHRLLCGSSLDPQAWALLLDGRKGAMAFTDPPYNVPVAGHVSGLGKVQHAEFAMASGEMSRPEFIAFLVAFMRHLTDHLDDGFGADIMIIDDLHKADEALTPVGREAAIQFYQNSLLSRFDDPANARIVVIQQRLHEEDIVGWLLERGGWHHLNLPAIAEHDEVIPLSRGKEWHRRKGELLHPDRVPMEFLEERRLGLGNRFFGAQYQQNPIIADGGQIRLGWFGQYDEQPERPFFHRVVQSWDTAATERITSDFSVGMTWGYRDGKWYLLDLIRKRLEFPDLVDRVKAWHRQWRADALLIEAASTGHSLYQEVRRAQLPGKVICPTVKGSKLDRLAGRTAQLATGDFLLPASADWLQSLCHELVAFPDGRHDDQVDALVQFLEFVFDWDRWITTEYDANGRRVRIQRRSGRVSRYYDGDAPSVGSIQP